MQSHSRVHVLFFRVCFQDKALAPLPPHMVTPHVVLKDFDAHQQAGSIILEAYVRWFGGKVTHGTERKER
jgi:hypothetical protein